MRASITAVAALVAALAVPAAAPAATLTAEPSPRDPSYETIAHYVAAPGEGNRVVVTRIDDHRIRIADPGAVITTGGRCTSIDQHTAECSSPGPDADGPNWFLTAEVRAGDLDDEVRSDGVGLDADGGAGNDTLVVDAIIASRLNGGGGTDQLTGGDNADTLIDGDLSGGAAADVLDGGDGEDLVSYEGRTAPVAVDLADGLPDGELGEHDVLRSIESAAGGAAADRLAGSGTSNRLLGGNGPDVLVGRGGDDFLDAGDGDDRALGGRGDDSVDGGNGEDEVAGERGDDILLARTGGADAVDCGRGSDLVAGPRRNDLLEPGCERVAFSFGDEGGDSVSASAYPHRTARSAVRFRVGCPRFEELDGESKAIRATMRLRERAGARRGLGRGSVSARSGARCADERFPGQVTVPVRLSARGRRLAARRGGVVASVSLRGRNLPSVAWSIRLRTR